MLNIYGHDFMMNGIIIVDNIPQYAISHNMPEWPLLRAESHIVLTESPCKISFQISTTHI